MSEESKLLKSQFEMYNLNKENLTNETKVKYLRNLSNRLKLQSNSRDNRDFIYKIIKEFYYLNSWEDYLKLSNFLLQVSIKENDKFNTANSFRSLGNYFYQKKNYEKSFIYFSKSEKNYSIEGKKQETIIMLFKKAIALYELDNFIGSELNCNKALLLLKNSNSENYKYGIYNLLGLIKLDSGDSYEAIRYFNKCKKYLYRDKVNYEINRIIILSNIGLALTNEGEHTKGIQIFEECLKYKNLISINPVAFANILENKSYSEMMIGRMDKVEYNFKKCLKLEC